MKKKTLIILIASIVTFVGLLAFVIYKNLTVGVPIENTDKMFAISDSSKVKAVFIADRNGNNVLLKRTDAGWVLNDGSLANPEMVQSMLATLMNIRVDHPVPEKQQENVMRVMATSANTKKVEIYADAPGFTLFNHPFNVKERLVKTIYIGHETPANDGNYATLEVEGLEEVKDKPYVISLPGFRGFVAPRFSPFKDDWVSHQLLTTRPTRIQTLEVLDCLHHDQSFTIRKVDDGHYDLFNSQNEKVLQYDTTRVHILLAEFRDKKFERVASGLSQEEKQSILQNNLFKIITLTDTQGQTIKLNCYFMDEMYDYYDPETGDKLTEIENLYNRDRFYATLNDDKAKLYVLQYFVFGNMVQATFSMLAGVGQ